MQLSNGDLSEFDEEQLLNVSEADLRRISIQLLNVFKIRNRDRVK